MDGIEFVSQFNPLTASYTITGSLGGRLCSVEINRLEALHSGLDAFAMARERVARILLRDRDMQCVFEIHIDDRESRVRITARRAAPLNYQYGRVEQWLDGPLDAASIENTKCMLRQRLEEATRNQEPPPEVVHWWSQPVDR